METDELTSGEKDELAGVTMEDECSNLSSCMPQPMQDDIIDQTSNFTNELSRGSENSEFCDNNSTNIESVNFDNGDTSDVGTDDTSQQKNATCKGGSGDTSPKENGIENGSSEKEKIIFSSEDNSNAMTEPITMQAVTTEPGQTKLGGIELDETEVVSEDELPAVEKPKIKDAENVSDDELPEPKRADLPADTEVVSEDELVTPAATNQTTDEKGDEKMEAESADNRKRKQDQISGGEQEDDTTSQSAEKKLAVTSEDESKAVPVEKKAEDESEKKKTLPELDKYWKVVNDDPSDFTGWTYLLQYVDQESDVESAREAYDAFLSHYPYCYGYWRKYADYEKRKGSKKKCLEVLERGLKAIPLSVDLWIHYLNHIKSVRSEDHIFIRSQFERAIDACGLEFRSDRLWEAYLKWEGEHGTPLHVTEIYDRLLATPTLGYTTHFDNFQEHIMRHPVQNAVNQSEIISIRSEVRATGAPLADDLPPGEDEPTDHIANEEEAQAVKERIIAIRRKIHKATGEQVTARWSFEEGIKRPYFHVKPLERSQLKNWKSYLDWEKVNGSFDRALVLHERCLIACALYEEFWLKLAKFLEERVESIESETDEKKKLIERCRDVLERACSVHHTSSPTLHLRWATFEEINGDPNKAADILERLDRAKPNLLQVAYRRANLERRRGDLSKAVSIYEAAVAAAKPPHSSALAIKQARFLFHVARDWNAADAALKSAIEKDPLCARLYLQRLHLAMAEDPTKYQLFDDILEAYTRVEAADPEMTASFARRALELAEELAPDCTSVRTAAERHRQRARLARHSKHPTNNDAGKRKEGTTATTTSNTSSTTIVTNSSSGGFDSSANVNAAYSHSYASSAAAWPHYQQHHPAQYGAWQYPNYY